MTDWHSETDRVELFPEIMYQRLYFMVALIKSGLPVATEEDDTEFLHYSGPLYDAAILKAEELAHSHGLAVYDRVAEVRP